VKRVEIILREGPRLLGICLPRPTYLQRFDDTTRISCCNQPAISEKEDVMDLSSRLQELRRKHAALSDKVEAAQRSPSVPDTEIKALKKQKLRLKDEIERLAMT
jgi:hypothetical protein